MNVLFICHPGSIHDIKWMNFVPAAMGAAKFCVVRKSDRQFLPENFITKLKQEAEVEFIGYIEDFSVARPWQTLLTVFRLKKIISDRKISILHALYAEPNALWAWWRPFLNTKMILTTRGSDILIVIKNTFESRKMIDRIVSRLYKSSLLKFDYITCTSLRQKELIMQLSGRKSYIEVIRTGVDLRIGAVKLNDEKQSKISGKKIVFFPRSMRPVYNHELAVDALELLPEMIKKEFAFVFVDSDSHNYAYVERIKSRMAAKKDVEFVFLHLLAQREMFRILKMSSLVVMTPLSDGSPVSAMEAMVCKVPVVLPDIGYDDELFNENTVSFFSPGNAEELAVIITDQLINPGKYQQITEEAFVVISAKANRAKEMEKLNGVYDSLLK